MSVAWDGQALLEPIAAEQPCGQNLDDSPLRGTLDSMRLFGRKKPPESAPDPVESEKEAEPPKPPPDWNQVRATSLELLAKSKDLRVLACLGTAVLRTDDLPTFAQVLTTAASWLTRYWNDVHPVIDEDAMGRRNALNCFADPMVVVDRVWRLPLVASRQHGRFGLRDIDLSAGQALIAANETRPDANAIQAAFLEMPIEQLTTLDQAAASATAALNAMDAKMREGGDPELAPEFGPLLNQFAKLQRVTREQLAARRDAAADVQGGGDGAATGTMAVPFSGGAIGSRQDAIRALEAVAEFFRRNEPSSPVPLFVERAKRLVAKDFLEVLADIAPDAVPVARSAGGIRDE